MKKWKDTCDMCLKAKEDVHGYYSQEKDSYELLCPSCAKKKGYKLWKPKGEEK